MWGFGGNAGEAGASGALLRIPGVPSGGCSTLVYFGCRDCAIEEARIAPAGGRVQRPKMSIGRHGFVTLGVDTEGNLFGLHSLQ
jgi:predicted enzyme related to lactoylglutathione lyase